MSLTDLKSLTLEEYGAFIQYMNKVNKARSEANK